MSYSKGFYNKWNETEQYIRLSEGCPNNCEYCYETKENGSIPIIYEIPEIKTNLVKIMDMNLTYKKEFIEILDNLGQRKVNNKIIKYELICGIDHRFMTQEKASALKRNHFINIRLAWDHNYKDIYSIYKTIRFLKNAGYKNTEIQVFIICNWKISYLECLEKLETLKYWNIQVSDCWYDNQLSPNIKPIFWKQEEIEIFRKKCRNHNIRCRHNGMQVEENYKGVELINGI